MSDGEAGGRRVVAEQLLAFLGDRALAECIPAHLVVSEGAPLSPGRPGALSFANGDSPDRLDAILACDSSLVLVEPNAFAALEGRATQALAAVANPRREFARVLAKFFAEEAPAGIAPAAIVSESVVLGEGTYVGPGAYLAPGVVIGEKCRIGANCVLLEGTIIGDHTSIGPNSTIGHVGFGYAREDDGSPVLIPHSGGVRIGSHVDIGANTCIDRGTLEDTVVEDDVKIDNLVHIAHNCRVERAAFVIATAILCGGVRVGPRAWVAPNASVLEQLSIGSDATVGLASTVIRDVPDGATVVGSPANELGR